MKRAYTLGTGRRTEEDFVEILLHYRITTVIDVRRIPYSKKQIFTRERLRDLLAEEGIPYLFLGAELGGLRKGGYEAYTTTGEFQRGIDRLEEALTNGNGVILCSQRFPWKCHRKWIARELSRRGWQIEHIIDMGKVWVPKQAARTE